MDAAQTTVAGSEWPAVCSLRKRIFIHNKYAWRYFYSRCVLALSCWVTSVPAFSRRFSFLLVPGGLTHPTEGEPGVCADLDGRCFRLPDSFLHRLHQILGVMDQHLRGLVREVKFEQLQLNSMKLHLKYITVWHSSSSSSLVWLVFNIDYWALAVVNWRPVQGVTLPSPYGSWERLQQTLISAVSKSPKSMDRWWDSAIHF